MEALGAIDRLIERLYGQPIIRNVLRGELVEQFVLDALGEGWIAAGDYEAWDVESVDGKHRLQVKQSSARQSWSELDCKASSPRFSIKASKTWVNEKGWHGQRARQATLYVFAWHPLVDTTADHRNPNQWEFFLVQSRSLPDQKSLSLNGLKALCSACSAAELSAKIAPLVLDEK